MSHQRRVPSVVPGGPPKARKKRRRGRLRGALPRLLDDHRTTTGADLRRVWSALVAEFGQPEPGSLLAIEFGRAAMALVRAASATRAWLGAQRDRDTGTGRRPTVALVARLAKRAALEESSTTALIDRLRALAAERRRTTGPTLAQELAAAKGALTKPLGRHDTNGGERGSTG